MNSPFSSKFVTLIRTFQPEELDQFDEWLRSSFCNRNKNLPPLFAALRHYYPDFNDPGFTKEDLFRKVLPNGKYSTRRMNNLLSEGFLAAKEFLAVKNFQDSQRWKTEAWLTELRQRHLDKWYFKEAIGAKEELQHSDALAWEEELSTYWLLRDLYYHPSLSYRTSSGETPITEMSTQLDLLYLLEKAAVITEKISRNRILKSAHHEVEQEIQIWQALSKDNPHPALQLYHIRFTELKSINLKGYGILSKAFLRHFPQLSYREQRLQLFFLLNDAATLIRLKKLDITQNLPLYKIGLDNGILLPGGRLSFATFVNVVVASNTKKSFQYTEQFIKQYASRIQENVRSDCLIWASAHTAFYKDQLENCTEILTDNEVTHPQFKFMVRMLNAQAYFELFLTDQSYESYLYNYLSTYERWLSRNRHFSRAYLKSATRFVQKCRQLAKYSQSLAPDRKELEQVLQGETGVHAVNWLRKKQQQILEASEKKAD